MVAWACALGGGNVPCNECEHDERLPLVTGHGEHATDSAMFLCSLPALSPEACAPHPATPSVLLPSRTSWPPISLLLWSSRGARRAERLLRDGGGGDGNQGGGKGDGQGVGLAVTREGPAVATIAAAMGGGEGGGDGGGGGDHPDGGDADADGGEGSGEMIYGSRGSRKRSASCLAATARSAIRQPHTPQRHSRQPHAPQRHSAAARPRSAIQQQHTNDARVVARQPTWQPMAPKLHGSPCLQSLSALAAARAAADDLRVERNTQAISKPFGSERVVASVSV